jgi:hypothetical protein
MLRLRFCALATLRPEDLNPASRCFAPARHHAKHLRACSCQPTRRTHVTVLGVACSIRNVRLLPSLHLAMADGGQHVSMAEGQSIIDPELQQKLEAFESTASVALESVHTRFQSLEAEFDDRGLNLFALLQPSTQHLVQQHTQIKPRDYSAPARRALAGSSWELNDEELVRCFGEKALESDKFVKDLGKLAADFAGSHK